MVLTPALLVPGTSVDTAQIVALMAIFAGALTLFEYASVYPGLIEFREAPPFNRIRFVALFVTILLLSVIAKGTVAPTTFTRFVTAVGGLVGKAIDFPYSPVNLVVLMLPEDAPVERVMRVRTAAGLSYLISLLSLVALFLVMRLGDWPRRNGRFNVWVNMPTFDPTTGGDVVYRLERDSTVNIVLGFVLPFLLPAVVKAATALFGTVSIMNDHTMIWTVAAWAFLPASLFMRGIAMGRVAAMIRDERARKQASESALQPA